MTGTAEPKPLAGAAYLRLVLVGALIGIPAALLASGFLVLVHQLEHVLWDDLPDQLGYSTPPWFLVVALPAIGGALVALARAALPATVGTSRWVESAWSPRRWPPVPAWRWRRSQRSRSARCSARRPR